MNRRRLLLAAALAALAPQAGRTQPRPVRIGMLSGLSLERSLYAAPIVRRLGELGYREGPGMKLEFRSPQTAPGSYAKLARELVDLKCDLVFVVGNEAAARSLREVGAKMPIVILAADYDPVAKGIVGGWSRPGGNITGVYLQTLALIPKRMEILREVLGGANRFLVLADPFTQDQLAALKSVAEARRIMLTVVQFDKPPYDYKAAFESARQAGVQGLVLMSSHVFSGDVRALAALTLDHRIPGIGFTRSADAGFLATYSVDNLRMAARVAEMGVRILKGASPAEMPLEQPDEFELVVNLKTAKALGVKMPYSVMARATRVIE